MQAYNIHKRNTLDRVSSKYAYRMKEIMRRFTESIMSDLLESLDDGADDFDPNVSKLLDRMENLLEDHQDETIVIAVSDGIREVSPEEDLSTWEEFPLYMPIEETLSVELAGFRDKVKDRQKFSMKEKFQARLKDLLKSQSSNYLDNLKKAYSRLASDWLRGEGTVKETKRTIADALRTSTYHAEMIFRTETTSYFNESRFDYFKSDTAVDYMQLFAVTDGRISEICETRHGFVIPIEAAGQKKYMPPFHPHCRTIQRPLISKLKSHKRLIDKGLAMNESRFHPLPRGWA